MDRSQNFVRDFPLQEKVDILNYTTRGLFNSFRRSVEDVAERNNICPDQVLWDLVLPGNRFMSILALSVYSGNYLPFLDYVCDKANRRIPRSRTPPDVLMRAYFRRNVFGWSPARYVAFHVDEDVRPRVPHRRRREFIAQLWERGVVSELEADIARYVLG